MAFVQIRDGATQRMSMALLGDPKTGKSTVRRLFCTDENMSSPVKLGIEGGSRRISANKEETDILLLEVASFMSYKSLVMAYYRGASAAFLFFDLTRRETFENLSSWTELTKWSLPPSIEFYLVATHSDCKDRVVTKAEAEKFADDEHMIYVELNATNKNEVDDLFLNAAQNVLSNIKTGKLDPNDPLICIDKIRPPTSWFWRMF